MPPVIQARGGNVGMPEPLLYLRNVRVMCERIRSRSSSQGMHAEAMYIGIDANYSAIALHNPLVHGIWMQMLRQSLGDIVLPRSKKRAAQIVLVLSCNVLRFRAPPLTGHAILGAAVVIARGAPPLSVCLNNSVSGFVMSVSEFP
jgi:hypothetical protein